MSDTPSGDVPRRTLTGGLRVHPVGIGCWALGGPDWNLGLPRGWSTANDSASRRGLQTVYALGANLFDTADVYGHGHSERILGQFLRWVPRDQVVIARGPVPGGGGRADESVPAGRRDPLHRHARSAP